MRPVDLVLGLVCLVLGVVAGFALATARLRPLERQLREGFADQLPSERIWKAAARLVERRLGDYPGCRHD